MRRWYASVLLFALIWASLALLLGMVSAQTATPTSISGQTFTGTNWVGQFYNTADLSGSVVATANFANGLNKDWGTGAPNDGNNVTVSGVNADNWSARFATTAQISAGLYVFTLTVDDGARLYLDGNLILDNFSSTTLISQAATVSLAGGTYTIIIDYTDRSGNARLQFSWAATTGTPSVTNTPAPLAEGEISGVRGSAVRTGPYIGASLINVARPGKKYELLARNTSEGIYTWYLAKISDNQIGWISGRYMTVTGTPDALTFAGSIFDQIDNAPDVGARGTTRSVMNFRVRPSARTQRITQIPWGDTVPIIGRTVQDGRDYWYQVIYQGRVGWILAAYVTARGDMSRVPVR
jgi:hypothetical protein